jgi:ABC-type lipoprotein release transport system permease subunit
MKELLKIAYRGLGRNRRRTLLSALALGLGVALLLMMAAFVEGEMRGSLELGIRLESGHLQVRARDYDSSKASLAWEDLVQSPDVIAAQVAKLAPVRAAAPRLYASGILLAGDESLGVRIVGLDPDSATTGIYREGLRGGAWLAADDREGVLIGEALAAKRNLNVGDRITLLVNTSNGDVDEQRFVIRGIYSTNTPSYDQSNILMPLAKAQAISQAGNRASLIWVMLDDMFQAEAVAAALTSSQYEVKTWEQLNEFVLSIESYSGAMMAVFYLIVLGITATVVVNAMVMAVFERTREIGVLAAIGMKGRRIMALFLIESFLLAVIGVAMGLVLGGIIVYWVSTRGVYLGDLVADMGVTGLLMGDRIYGYLTAQDATMLVIAAFAVTMLASLYPAMLAAHMEPVQALHGGEA